MKLEIECSRNRFIVKEALVFTVRFRNDGPAPVNTPDITDNRNVDLTYELRGPSAPDGQKFFYGSAADFRLPGEPEMIPLNAGEVQENTVDMVKYVADWKPGPHQIVARWKDLQSQPFQFTIIAPQVKSAQVLSDGWPVSQGVMRIAFLEAQGGLYQGFFSETDGTVETPATSRFVEAVTVPADAEKVLTPWCNFDRGSVFFSRFGWVGKNTVGMRESREDSKVETTLGGGVVIGPALMVDTGEVRVFVANGKQLSMVRVPRKGQGEAGKSWQLDLPREIAAGTSALGSRKGGNVTAALAVMEEAAGVTLAVVSEGKVRTQPIDRCRLIPGSQPALWINDDGTMHAALIVSAPAPTPRVQLVEAVWKPGQSEAQVTKGNEVASQKKPIGATAIFAPAKEKPRCDWAVALEGGEVLSSRSAGEPRHFGTPVMPLQLLARTKETYLLVHNPVDVLSLILLR